jgi:hypothetical protein
VSLFLLLAVLAANCSARPAVAAHSPLGSSARPKLVAVESSLLSSCELEQISPTSSLNPGLRREWGLELSPRSALPAVRSYQSDVAAGQLVDGRYFSFVIRLPRQNPPRIEGIRISSVRAELGLADSYWIPRAKVEAKTHPRVPSFQYLTSHGLGDGTYVGIWKRNNSKSGAALVLFETSSTGGAGSYCILAPLMISSPTLWVAAPLHRADQLFEVLGSGPSDGRYYLIRYALSPTKVHCSSPAGN